MALLKPIIQNNGIVLSYHRVTTLTIHTNNQNIIEITSYINQEEREKEKMNLELLKNNSQIEEDKFHNVYINTLFYNIDYNEDMSIKSAYEYLKTLPEFENAEDI